MKPIYPKNLQINDIKTFRHFIIFLHVLTQKKSKITTINNRLVKCNVYNNKTPFKFL